MGASKGGDHSGTFIKMLIDAGADVDGETGTDIENDDQGIDIPLTAAINSIGDKACAINNMKILLQAGTNVNFSNEFGQTPLHELLERLIQLAMRDGYEAMKEYLESVDMLLAAGANKWAKDDMGKTPLQNALWMSFIIGEEPRSREPNEGEKAEKEKAAKKLSEMLYGWPRPLYLDL